MTYLWGFWTHLVRLVVHPTSALDSLDIPLEQALTKSRWFSAWAALMVALSVWISRLQHGESGLLTIRTQGTYLNGVLSVVLAIVWIPVFYALFRLYTLITHVITLNVFKTRGQRLRLLNLLTSLLPMTVLAPVISAFWTHIPVVSVVLLCAALVELIWVFALGYNKIFHKTGLRGVILWLEGTLVSGFVLAIGALAVTVTIGVLAFFVLLFLRMFTAHGTHITR